MFESYRNIIRSNPTLYSFARSLRFRFARSSAQGSQPCYELLKVLRSLSSTIAKHELTGGIITESGEYYLETDDGLFLYYNSSDYGLTLGDGQCLEFKAAHRIEPFETFLMSHLRDGMVYLDIGANNGYYYSMKVARRYAGCKVYAFEPNRLILRHLQKNVEYNRLNNITVVPQALSNRAGSGHLASYLGASAFLVDDRVSTETQVDQVVCDTLDHFVERNDLGRMDVIKIDVEGGEYNILKGGQNSIGRLRPVIVIELNDALLNRAKSCSLDAISLLRNLGYSLYHVASSNDALCLPVEKVLGLKPVGADWLKEVH